jgi:hypothetical protein
MDQRYVSLSRTGYRVALLAGCVLLAPSAARAAPPHDVPGPVTVNSTSGNTVANWSAFLDEAGVSACAGPQVQGRMAATMSIAVSDALNAIAPRSPQIAFHGRELTASARPAVAAAASTSLVEVLRSIPGPAPPGALAANFQAGHASSILVTRSTLRAVKQGLRLPPRPQRQIHTAAALVHLDGQHLV